MANQVTLGVILQGTDKLSQIFKANGQAAKAMGGEVEQSLSRASGSFGKLAAAGAAWGAAAGAVVDVTRAATAAYAESEQAQLRLENAISNAGQSFDEYKTQIEAASAAAVQLGFDDEDLSDALTALTQATGDTGAALDDLTMVQDLARAKNMSLADAAKVVADAEAGRMRGLVGLGLGIDAAMSKEEAFAVIMQKTGGAAEAYGNSTAGAIDRVQVQLGNLLEKAGGLAAPIAPLIQLLPAVQGGYTLLSTAGGALTAMLTGQTAAATANTAATTADAAAKGASAAAAGTLAAAEGSAAAATGALAAAQGTAAAATGASAVATEGAAVAAAGLAVAEGAAGTAAVGASVGIAATGAASEVAAVGMETAAVASKGLMASLGPIGLGLAAVAAVAALFMLSDGQSDAQQAAEDLAQAEADLTQTILGLATATTTTAAQAGYVDSIQAQTTAFEANAEAAEKSRQEVLSNHAAVLDLIQASGEDWIAYNNLNQGVETNTDLLEENTGELDDNLIAAIDAAGGHDLLVKAMDPSSPGGTAITFGELNDIIKQLSGSTGEATDALTATNEILQQSDDAGQDTTKTLQELDQAWRDYYAAIAAGEDPGVALSTLMTTLNGIQTELDATTAAQGRANEQTQAWLDTITGFDEQANETWQNTVTNAEGVSDAIDRIFSATGQGAYEAQEAYREASEKLKVALNDSDPSNDLAAWTEFNTTVKGTADSLDDSTSALDAWALAWDRALDPTDDVGKSMQTFAGAVNDADPKIKTLNSDLDLLAGSTEYAAKVQDAYNEYLRTGDLDAYLAKVHQLRLELEGKQTAEAEAQQAQAEATAASDRALMLNSQTMVENMNSTNELNQADAELAAQKQASADAAMRQAQLQAGAMSSTIQLTNDANDAEARRVAAILATQNAVQGSTDAQVQSATALAQAQQLQAETALGAATAAGGTQDELAGQAAATNALAQAQQLQAQTSLDNAAANGQLPPTLAQITIELQTMRGAIDDARDGTGQIAKGMQQFVGAIKPTNPAMAELNDNLLFLADASPAVQDEVVNLYEDFATGEITADEFATKIDELTAAEEENRGTTAEAAASAEELTQAWKDATQEAGNLILQLDTLVAQLVAMGDPTAAQSIAYGLNLATAAADDLRRVIIQLPDGIASAAQSTLDWANELVNVRGTWGRIDELQREAEARGTPGLFDGEDWENAQQAQESLEKTTADIQFYTDVIQAKLIPYLADAQEEQAAYLETLAAQGPEAQLAALGYMDQAESAKALAVAQQMAAASASGNEEQTQQMLEAMIAADPVLKAMLIDMGLLTEQPDGSYKFEFENADATVTTLDDVVGAVTTLSAVLAQAFHLDINQDGIDDATQSIETLTGQAEDAKKATDDLNKAAAATPPSVAIGIPIATPTGDDPATVLQGIKDQQTEINTTTTTVTMDYSEVNLAYNAAATLDIKLDDIDNRHITVFVDYVNTGTPPGAGPGNALGGVITPKPVAYALGGRVSLVGETGPELVKLPYGSMVTPATATAMQMRGGSGGGAVNLYGPVTVVASDPQQFAAKLRARRLTEARS